MPVLIAAVIMMTAAGVHAQIMGPTIPKHHLEAGYIYKWYERDFDSTFLGREKWSTGAFYLRYGSCRWATLSIEGGVWTVHHDDFPENDFRRYTIGMGITSLVYDTPRFGAGFSMHYSEIFDHDRSRNQFDKNTRDITVAIQVHTDWELRRTHILIWGGPALIYDQSRQFPWQTDDPVRNDTTGNFGFVAGVNFLYTGHISAFGYLAYADAFQPRLGVGYRF